ncbi:MAG: 6-carboxytetrahydropterin synthase [Ignavibacteriales bacterium CG_4_9_14_3_um_filter_30_11]|nr:MAG: 6-carboxytetrahydropterin synthase [Ignavibacteriales bacterium CG_4_9_14_3_um_filter_30_11]
MKIAKEFRWEMGHRLPDHFGKCKNIHGHSYKMMVEFEGELDKNGMIIDYYIVKEIIEPIVEKLDHSFMVNKKDNLVLDFLEKLNSKKMIVDFDSTVENITRYLIKEISKASLPKNVTGLKVRVCETPDDYAEETTNLNYEL